MIFLSSDYSGCDCAGQVAMLNETDCEYCETWRRRIFIGMLAAGSLWLISGGKLWSTSALRK